MKFLAVCGLLVPSYESSGNAQIIFGKHGRRAIVVVVEHGLWRN